MCAVCVNFKDRAWSSAQIRFKGNLKASVLLVEPAWLWRRYELEKGLRAFWCMTRCACCQFREEKTHIHFNWFISISTWGLAPIAASRVHFATPSQRKMGTLPRPPRWQVLKVTGSYRYLSRRFKWVTVADQSKPWRAQTMLNCQTRPVLCGLSTCWQLALAAGGWVDLAHTLHSRFSIWDTIYSTDHLKDKFFTAKQLPSCLWLQCYQVVPQHCQNIIWSSLGETSVEQSSLSFRGVLIVFKVGGSDSSNTTEILPVSGGPNTRGFIFRLFATIFKQFGQGHHYLTSLQSLLSITKPYLACVYRWWYHLGSGPSSGA